MSTLFDEIGKKLRERRKQLLQANLMGAAETTPDQHARVIDLSERSGIPQQLIEPNLKQYQSEDKWRRVNYQRIIKNSPGLAKWLEDQSNAKLASDDLDNLERVEKGLTGLSHKIPIALIEAGRAAPYVPPDIVRSVSAGAADQGIGQAMQGAGSAYTHVSESLSNFVPFRDELDEALAPIAPYVDVGAGLRALGGLVSSVGEDIRPPEERRGFHTEVGEAFGQLGAQIGLTLANPAAGAMSFGFVGYQQGLEEARAAGATEDQQIAAATLSGLAVLASEKTGIDLLLKRIPPKIRHRGIRFLVDTALAGGIEAVEERIEGILQDLVRKNIYDPEHEIYYNFGREEGVALTAAGIVRAMMHGLTKGRTLMNAEERAAERVEQFKAVRDQVTDTETFKRHKESFRTFAQSALEEKDAKVYLDANQATTYFQSAGEDPETYFQQLGVKDQVREATTLGGDLVVNLEDFMTVFADSEHFDGLVVEARLNKGDLSYREVVKASQQYAENLQTEAEQVLQQHEEDVSFQQSADAVHTAIKEQLIQAGEDPIVADYDAALHRANAVVLSEDLGITPQQVYEKFGLKVFRQDSQPAPDGANQYNQDAEKKPVIKVVGNELGEFDDSEEGIVNLKKAARAVYRKLQQSPAKRVDLGDIKFTGKGWKEFTHTGASLIKWKMMPVLKEIVEKGEYKGESPLKKERKDGIVKFHWIESEVEVEGKLYKVGVDVGEDAEGNKFVNLNQDLDDWRRKYKTPDNAPVIKTGGQGFEGQDEPITLKQSIADGFDGVNITILSQGEGGGNKNNSGTIDLYKDMTKNPSVIRLLEGKDLSTFLHESGHFFLEQRIQLVRAGEASERMQRDMDTLLRWFGVESIDQIDTDQHEQFARGFEIYLREGKAPSTDLQSIFDRFAAWLALVYKTIRGLNVELTDEVRSVMDRMLATQEAIDEAESAARLLPLFELAEEAQMTAAEFEAYNSAAVKATAAAKRDLLQKSIEDEKRQRTREWRDAWNAMREEVEEELAQLPVYQAKEFLMHGRALGNRELNVEPMKLSKPILLDLYGDAKDAPWRRLPVGRHTVMADDGVHPDVVAALFGYDSGQEMVETLVDAGSFSVAVKAETQRRMEAEHGNLKDPTKLAEAAIESTHNRDERTSFLEQELRALEKRMGLELTPRQVLKNAAARIVAMKRARDIREGDYMRDHLKAARAAEQALAAGDFANAANEKRRQILNLYAWREAKEARKKIDSAQKYFNKFSKPGTRKNLARDYLDQIDQILEAYDFKKSVTNQEIDKRKRLLEWIAEQRKEGNEVIVPDNLIEQASRTHYRDLLFEELMALRDYIKNIEHLARFKQRLIIDGQQREFEEVVDELVSTAEENHEIHETPDDYTENKFKKLKQWGDKFFAAHQKAEFIFHELDGNEHGGVWWRYLFKPLAEAETAEQEKVEVAVAELNEIFAKFDRKERASWYRQKIHIKELDGIDKNGKPKPFTGNKTTILSIALNWGNLDNRDRIMNGHVWSEAQVQSVLFNDKYMGQREWELVQEIWDHIDSYWSDIASLQKEITGVVPQKVKPANIETPWGMFKGGYYPLKYDTERSFLAFKRDEKQDLKDLYGGNAMRPATRQGHTKERTAGAGQKVKLDLGVVHEHIHQVIHDLTHRRVIHQTDRLINNPEVQKAIEGAAGREVHLVLRPWLANIAADQNVTNNPVERAIGHFRHGATIVNMGWKLSTAIVQPLGYLQTLEMLGEKWSMIGLQRFYSHPKKNLDMVFEKSTMMRNRAKTFDRDVRDAINKVKGDKLKDKLEKTFFSHIGFFDLSVSLPSWLGAYEKSLAEGRTEKEAIAFADSIVRMSQSAGGAKDLANVQVGPEIYRMFTMFYSYFSVLYNMLRRRVRVTQQEGLVSTPRAFMSFMYLVVLPAVLSELIAGRGPEDDEDAAIWTMKTVAGYPAATVVLARDIANGIFTPYGYDLSPVGAAVGSIGKASESVADIVTGEGDETDLKNLTMATGYVFGLPARQLWTVGDNLEAMMSGEDVNLFEALMIKEVKD
ncbi:MAG: hypothetical protein AB2784_20945 [Candidatus Thiodiazotropha endolucinida]